MDKKMPRFISLYLLVVVLAAVVLTASAVILSASKPASKQIQSLTTSSASDLKVHGTEPSTAPGISDNGSGSASSSGTVTLQAGQATSAPGGISYPCASCPEASSTTDVMVCADYCVSPAPESTPTPNPNPVCDPCHGNTYGTSDKMTMCPMIACPNIY